MVRRKIDSFPIGIGLPLKIMLFPVHQPGDLMSAEWVIFF